MNEMYVGESVTIVSFRHPDKCCVLLLVTTHASGKNVPLCFPNLCVAAVNSNYPI